VITDCLILVAAAAEPEELAENQVAAATAAVVL
jgi:hypothetical protein